MNIGTNIYTLRKEKKITQAQLAEKLGVSEQSVSKWENDQCAPDVSLFPIIAEYFCVSIDRLFGYHMNSYENEVHDFVEKLLNQISAVENSETGKVDCFIFEDESQFTERHLLWGCFDLLIKAELTIGSLKRSRMKLMQELLKQDNTE